MSTIGLAKNGNTTSGVCGVLWPVCPEGHGTLVQAAQWAWCPDCCHLEERAQGRDEPCGRPVACRVEEDGSADEYCRGHGLHFVQQFDGAQIISLVE